MLQSKKDDVDELQRMQILFNQTEPNENVLKHFRRLYDHTTLMKDDKSVLPISCTVEVFGGDRTIYLLHENLIALFKFEMIGQAIISTYMM